MEEEEETLLSLQPNRTKPPPLLLLQSPSHHPPWASDLSHLPDSAIGQTYSMPFLRRRNLPTRLSLQPASCHWRSSRTRNGVILARIYGIFFLFLSLLSCY